MLESDRSWMRLDKSSPEWQKGLLDYLESIFRGTFAGQTAPCPCAKCRCQAYITKYQVERHLLLFGFDESYSKGDDLAVTENTDDGLFLEERTGDGASMNDLVSSLIKGAVHGDIIADEEPNAGARAFFNLLKEAQKELYPGCKEATKVSFIVRLFQIKCMFGISNNAMAAILQLFSLVLPEGHCVPNTLDKVQKVVRDLGLDYQKIDACVNDCILFRGDYADIDTCPTCGERRWRTFDVDPTAVASGKGKKRYPRKVLRYFPLIPRLQRLYMRETTSSYMRWHKEGLVRDGKMRHPADSPAWKHVDDKYKDFASDPRNIRLGLASDGFNPFGMLNVTYTTWPVIIIPYNLPPWLCLKQSYWMMSMLVPGPKSPGMNIDVYLQPLIDELKDLWERGVETWDAKEKKNFTMQAVLLWTINDFPAYAMLSGWSTKGKFACPYCHKDTNYLWLKYGSKHCYMGHRRFLPKNHKWRKNKISFNNMVETRESPVPLTGDQVLQQFQSFEQPKFGKTTRKRKQRDEDNRWHNWRKKSIFFELPYWASLLIRHNLDVMHIEKNICESILGTLLGIEGKTKDTEKARLDLQHLGIRQDQHPVVKNNRYTLPPALYSLGKQEKEYFLKFLEGVRMPDGYASNIKKSVNVDGCKLSTLKTHDYHVIFEKLLPLVVRGILPKDVIVPLIELSMFFNAICSKELDTVELDRLSISIKETLCRLEMIFPPAFFDIMVHLPVHLAEEAKQGGPVCYRWMYPIERYLRTLKGYVRNKAYPEGSIAEGYISEECMTFCSRFLEDVDTKLNRPERNQGAAVDEPPCGLSIFGSIDYSKKGGTIELIPPSKMHQLRHYIITNCDEAVPWIKKHMDKLTKLGTRNVEVQHKAQFVGWFEREIRKLYEQGNASEMLYALSRGPDNRARFFNRCSINGFLFRTASADKNLSTQNSGVVVKGDDSTRNMNWYGVIQEILSLEFSGEKEVLLFQCDWYDVPAGGKNKGRGYIQDKYGIIDIDTTRFRYSCDPYILGTQAEQVVYVKGVKKPNWCSVLRMKPRNLFSMPEVENIRDECEIDLDSLVVGVGDMTVLQEHEELTSWRRNDMEGVNVDASVIDRLIASSGDEPTESQLPEDEENTHDTYVGDGYVAPLNSVGQDPDDEFFV